MSSIGTSQAILEIAKFALYVTVPPALMYTIARNPENLKKVIKNVSSRNPENLKKVIKNRSYVVYPPEGPPPPSPEELREMAREIARKKNMR